MNFNNAYNSNDQNFLNMIFTGDELQESLNNLGFQGTDVHMAGSTMPYDEGIRLNAESGDQAQYEQYLAALGSDQDARVE